MGIWLYSTHATQFLSLSTKMHHYLGKMCHVILVVTWYQHHLKKALPATARGKLQAFGMWNLLDICQISPYFVSYASFMFSFFA